MRVITFNTFNVLEHCLLTNWFLTVEAVLQTLSAFGNAMISWIGSGFQQEFAAKPIFDGLGGVIYSFVRPLSCVCGDLFFAWDYAGSVLNNQHLHWALHHVINVALDILVQIFTLLFDILTIRIFTGYFGCMHAAVRLI